MVKQYFKIFSSNNSSRFVKCIVNVGDEVSNLDYLLFVPYHNEDSKFLEVAVDCAFDTFYTLFVRPMIENHLIGLKLRYRRLLKLKVLTNNDRYLLIKFFVLCYDFKGNSTSYPLAFLLEKISDSERK